MKNVIIAIALLMMTKPLWPVVDYVVNYDYIVSSLCENRDSPEMHCNGKCYLAKELAKETENDKDNPFNSKNAKTEIPQIIISEEITPFQFAASPELSGNLQIFNRPVLYFSNFTTKILHPPRIG